MDNAQAKILAESVIGSSVGGWAIDGRFGNGKSAVVLSAAKDGLLAAVKVFHPELIERYGKAVQLERINREKTLIGAKHPHLVQILDGGECDSTGHLFVVMERLPYKNLHEARALIPPSRYGKLISQVATAARFLEDRNLAHRDIKPENIAITDDFERAVLMDLGVLLPIGLSDLTDVDQRPFIGTLRYSSPEFLDRKEQDTAEGWRAVTFYQMGAVLHDLIMQKPLFEEYSEPFSQLVDAVHHRNPPISGGDSDLMHLSRRALAKDPTTRLDLLKWSDFEDVAKENASSLDAQRKAIIQRQKLSRSQASNSALAEAENRRLFVQRMDQFSRRLDTRLASVLSELGCFPLRSCTIEASEGDTRRLFLNFSPNESLGMGFPFGVMFVLAEIDYNEGSPQYSITYSDLLANKALSSADFCAGASIFKGPEEDLFSGSVLQNALMASLLAYYQYLEQHILKDGETVQLTGQECL